MVSIVLSALALVGGICSANAAARPTQHVTSSGDRLSSVGVAVVGLGAVGTVLIVGGGFVLLVGRRRKIDR